MTTKERVTWGLLAGVAIVLVKILGPDDEFVRSIFISSAQNASMINYPELLAYSVISIVTILLGGIAGAFTKENERTKILLFAVSFPALLSTVTAQKRAPVQVETVQNETARVDDGKTSPVFSGLFIRKAFAQQANQDVCIEASFTTKVLNSAAKYVTGSDNKNTDTFNVVIASEKDLETAKSIANVAQQKTKNQVFVGCRRPDNEFYPVYVGEATDLKTATEKKGALTEADLLGNKNEPYISNYPYRTSIYAAQK